VNDKKQSIVLGLVATIYDHHPPKGRLLGGAKSFRRLNDALHRVLSAAITASLPFELNDFGEVYARCGGEHWFGSPAGERFYTEAVKVGNMSACKSFEHWVDRKPFMWQKKRLYLYSVLRWQGQQVVVTSFADDGLSLTACSYGFDGTRCPSPQYPQTGKILNRFTITHKELQAAMKELRSQDIRVKIGTMPAGVFRLVGTKLPRVGDRFTVLEDGKKARLLCNEVRSCDGEPLWIAERW
jgi:hypothetical protein